MSPPSLEYYVSKRTITVEFWSGNQAIVEISGFQPNHSYEIVSPSVPIVTNPVGQTDSNGVLKIYFMNPPHHLIGRYTIDITIIFYDGATCKTDEVNLIIPTELSAYGSRFSSFSFVKEVKDIKGQVSLEESLIQRGVFVHSHILTQSLVSLTFQNFSEENITLENPRITYLHQ